MRLGLSRKPVAPPPMTGGEPFRRVLLAVLLAASMTLSGTSGCSNPHEPEYFGYGEECTVNGTFGCG